METLFKPHLLTEESPASSNPPHFQGGLYGPQAAVLQRMVDMEKTQLLPTYVNYCGTPALLEFNAGLLSAPFAFGKTVIIAALVAFERPPRRAPIMVNLPCVPESGTNLCVVRGSEIECTNRRGKAPPAPFDEPARHSLSTFDWVPGRTIRSTLIVAAPSVLSHWEKILTQFTPHLSCFMVDGIAKLREYVEMVRTGEHAEYHVVLLKAGTMSLKSANGSGLASSLTALNWYLPGLAWDRLVIDDFDTIPLPVRSQLPPAFFTWYVSATKRVSLVTVQAHTQPRTATAEEYGECDFGLLLPSRWPALASTYDYLLHSTLAVNCTEEFRNSQFTLPAPVYTDYHLEGGAVLKLFNGLKLPADVLEALSGGAVGAAATKLGFECRTEAELVLRILKKKRIIYTQAVERLAALEQVEATLKARGAGPESEITLTATRQILTEIRQGWRPAPESPLPPGIAADATYGSRFAEGVAEFVGRETEKRGSSGRALERLKENAEEGACQVCVLPWKDCDADTRFITNCCQILVCGVCVTAKSQGKVQFVSECPNCFAKLFRDGQCFLLSIGSEIDVTKLSDVTADELDAGDKSKTSAAGGLARRDAPTTDVERRRLVDQVWTTFHKDNKIRALLEFVFQLPITCLGQKTGRPVPDLLGNDGPTVAIPPEAPRRVLVFSYHRESTLKILDAFKAADIRSSLLQGRRAEKDRLIKQFRTSQKPLEILIITASRDCSGIHLPECTDQVFYHRVVSTDVAAQLVGRGQRPGRKGSLRVHTLCYDSIE